MAVDILKNQSVDLIISDLMMPMMNGLQLLETLKSNDLYRSIPLIILTGLKEKATKLNLLTKGVDDYLIKPFHPQELLARVYNLLERKQAWKVWAKEQLTEQERALTSSRNDQVLEPFDIEGDATLQVSFNDTVWIKDVEAALYQELTNSDFRLPDLAEQFHLSNSQFARRIKKITGLTPKKYQQEIALQAARELLESGKYRKVTAVAYSVGINNIGRFSKLYESRFGKRPSAYFT